MMNNLHPTYFLALIGAQETLILVRSSVRSAQTCLEQSIFIILAQIFKQSVRTKSAVSEQSKYCILLILIGTFW